MKNDSLQLRLYVIATVACGLAFVALSFTCPNSNQWSRVLLYVLAAALASQMRVNLPGITGTMSVNFVFTLVAVLDLGLWQVLMVASAGVLGQIVQRRKHYRFIQVAFNLASITVTGGCTYTVYHSALLRHINSSLPVLLLASASALFLTNTFSVAGIIALSERKNAWKVWRESFAWTASHYMVGAALAAIFHAEEAWLGWEAVLLTAPVISLVYRSYAAHLQRLEAAKVHSRELADLHWRTIEALALAIDAKDETTHTHLLRVKVYATEVGKELNLNEVEMQALQAASLLHDIGKLAVPEHIISKPGKLTPEEFEKMKVHPVVGAEILDRVRFPYPVVPIVHSHHEKWNGKGYPHGLKGEEIPIGARILSAVDCLDALASDRQYRKALPLDQAMKIVASESGESFDPRIVEILQRRYVELEHLATSIPEQGQAKLSTNVKFELGEAPASGFESSSAKAEDKQNDCMASIAAARCEFQNLLKLTSEIEGVLSVEDVGSLLAPRVKRMVAHDTIAVFILNQEKLTPAFVGGEDLSYFSTLSIPMGQGLSGWVAENRLPIVNGNPSVENTGDVQISGKTRMRSALSVPLERHGEVLGAMTLYSAQTDFYSKDSLRVLQAICSKASVTIASALQHERLAQSAVTDHLTNLPNARSLFQHLDESLTLAARHHSRFGLIVLDINGFKHINDTFGHLTGNKVLQLVARQVRQACDDHDYVARLGGDEFVIVLGDADHAALEAKIQRVKALACCSSPEWGFLSVSAGFGLYSQDGVTVEELLEVADQRMYDDKRVHYQTMSSDLLATARRVENTPCVATSVLAEAQAS